MITDPAAVRFSNEQIRTIATRYAAAYYDMKRAVADWFAQEVNTAMVNDAGEVVDDGAAVDGRAQITGADVNNVVTRMTEVIADLEAAGGAKLNTLLAVAVNKAD